MTRSRVIAARIMASLLLEHRNLDRLFSIEIPGTLDNRDQSLIRELCYGVTRHFFELDQHLKKILNKPLRKKDTDIRAIILCGLYQLLYMRIPEHAAISESVKSATDLGKPWAGALINASLRRFQREKVKLVEIPDDESVRFNHPQWMIDAIRNDWPGEWDRILAANNDKPPMHLRVNITRNSRASYMSLLQQAGIAAIIDPLTVTGIRLEQPVAVSVLPGFAEGLVSVQDLGAQYAPGLMDLRDNMTVLDACAAPGGKTALIMESHPGLASLTAVDKDEMRVERLRETCHRLGLDVEVICADVCEPGWRAGRRFDRILLDAPCSATGVIRRHPDIKLLKDEKSLEKNAKIQLQLLESVWSMLESKGKLVYVTCSVLARENDMVIAGFLDLEPTAVHVFIDCNWGIKTRSGRQTLPGISEADGFYYAVLEKQ